MKKRIAITLTPENWSFLETECLNKSAYINTLILKQRKIHAQNVTSVYKSEDDFVTSVYKSEDDFEGVFDQRPAKE